MALEQIGKPITCRVTGTFAVADTRGEPVAVYLANSETDNEPYPTVGKVTATNNDVYGKLLSVVKGGDAFNVGSIDANGNVTRGDIVTVAPDGILAFTKRSSSDAVDDGVAGDIGKGIDGVGTAGGHVTVHATAGTGKVVAYDGSTIYVDLRA